MEIRDILENGTSEQKLALFQFDSNDSVERIVVKFNLWGRHNFPKFFQSKDAPFHKQFDTYNVQTYRGIIESFTNLGFRNSAKTTRTKLLFAYCIANDKDHSRKYMKVLSEDGDNSKQSVTDIYNLLIDPKVEFLYPEIFAKTEAKREETMSSFTTSTGIKLIADTVGASQRGQIQEEARPDWIWYDDFETKVTLRSPVKTKAIWDNMEEAKQGLAKGGAGIYTANYISERGNVQKLVEKEGALDVVLITPIRLDNGLPSWPQRYTPAEVDHIIEKAEDAEGEYLQNPAATKDVLFDRNAVDRQVKAKPIKEIGGFKMFKLYNPSHRYAGGMDVAGGVGLDSSTEVYIDFDTIPAQVVGTYFDNLIQPDAFGDQIDKDGKRYGECLVAVEKNNHGHATIGRLKQLYDRASIYRTKHDDTKIKEDDIAIQYGWQTNSLSKSKMFSKLGDAVENGLIALNDPDLIKEARSYTRNDVMDAEVDPRLTTRHFDLLTACAIAWQMKDWATVAKPKDDKSNDFVPEEARYPSIGV